MKAKKRSKSVAPDSDIEETTKEEGRKSRKDKQTKGVTTEAKDGGKKAATARSAVRVLKALSACLIV